MVKEAIIEAAVMVVYDSANGVAFLEKRERPDRVYFGEEIFFGGVVDDADNNDPAATARRELWEELEIEARELILLTDKPIMGEYGYLQHPFLVKEWEGKIPEQVIGSKNEVVRRPLEEVANSPVASIAAIARLAIRYLEQENQLTKLNGIV